MSAAELPKKHDRCTARPGECQGGFDCKRLALITPVLPRRRFRGLVFGAIVELGMEQLRRPVWWIRDAANPVLPGLPDSEFEKTCCMNPFVMRRDDQYWLYYAGGDALGRRRICLATAPASDVRRWTRHGVVLDVGEPGSFDAHWVVLPHVVRFGDRWHLYYTGNCGHGEGLAAFRGIGLGVSNDGIRFERFSDRPVLVPGGRPGDPDRYGVAGGSVLRVRLPDGSEEWRFYYTGCPTLGDDLFRNQQKICCLAVSKDGIHWEKRGAVMSRDSDRDYVNVAAAGPVVEQHEDGTFRMMFSAIGTRWGYYSICYAESHDGVVWRRGEHYGDDLTLGPIGDGWERQMVEYPSVVREGSHRRLFYCGNGYGATGIGTAVSCPLRAVATKGPCKVRIVASEAGYDWQYRMPEGVSCEEGVFKSHALPIVDWHGPTGDGMIWHEWQTSDEHLASATADESLKSLGLCFIQGLWYRVILQHRDYGLEVIFTVSNLSNGAFHNVTAFPCLGMPSPEFRDDVMDRTFIETESGLTSLKDTDRGSGHPIRTHYGVRGQRSMKYFGRPFWGDQSATTATGGAILRASADGRWTIGTNWEAAAEIYHNEDSYHHCIHSVPSLGDVEPGETKTVKGRIAFIEGCPARALELLRFK